MFRYERPQQGRSRQFHQIGVESLGDPSPNSDIQVISMAAHLLEEWGLLDEATVCPLEVLL
jgi:histidyl-tRNA synthetase